MSCPRPCTLNSGARGPEHSIFLKPDRGAAGVCQQPMHLCLESALIDVSHMVGSVGQIRIGRTRFTEDLEFEICGCLRVFNRDIDFIIEVKEVTWKVTGRC